MAEFSFDVSAAIDRLCSPLKTGLGILSADLGTCFKRYLTNAYENYNNVKTLVSRDTPRQIIGDDEIYVSVGVKYWNLEVDTGTVEPLIRISKHLIIEGMGGAGKTMLMKFLFLNTIINETYIPVLVRLNKISNQPVDKISIYDLIYKTIGEFSDDVTKEAFKRSLYNSKKKYLFLFDGFDEIAGSHAQRAAIEINNFCKRYPGNPCIVTSRPGMDYTQFRNFLHTRILPLSKEQAVELASKLCLDKEKTTEFCEQLEEELFDKHEEFAENPLLLSMMFLTFIDYGSVPDRIVDFYDKAYNALYSNHDRFKEGEFKRIFESSLKPNEFKTAFSYFCYRTYMMQKYSFKKEEIFHILAECGIDESEAEKYLNDLITSVCLIIKDGTEYTFAHRSFQTYFASLYTLKLSDKRQREIFKHLLTKDQFSSRKDYYECLIQLDGENFAVKALECGLRELYSALPFDKSEKPDADNSIDKFISVIDFKKNIISPDIFKKNFISPNTIDAKEFENVKNMKLGYTLFIAFSEYYDNLIALFGEYKEIEWSIFQKYSYDYSFELDNYSFDKDEMTNWLFLKYFKEGYEMYSDKMSGRYSQCFDINTHFTQDLETFTNNEMADFYKFIMSGGYDQDFDIHIHFTRYLKIFTSDEMDDFYKFIMKALKLDELRSEIKEWLDSLDEKRKAQKANDNGFNFSVDAPQLFD